MKRIALSLAALALAFGLAAPASAAGWTWTFTPYAWATDVGVGLEIANRQVVDETIPVADLLEDLDTIAQFRIEVGRGHHALMVDLFDVTMSDRAENVTLPQGTGTGAVDWEMGMTILDVAGVYDPSGVRLGLNLVYGVRVINERGGADATFDLASGGTVAQSDDGGSTDVDGLLGVRFTKPLSRRFALQTQADITTGGTEFTWSVSPALAYAFGEKRRHALSVGYRRMDIHFEEDHGVESDVTLSGLLIGFRSSF